MAKKRRCEFCGDELPKDARPNRRYCDDDCRRGRVRPSVTALPDPPDVELGEVEGALEEAIAKARAEHGVGPKDAATLAAARVLARKIDEEQARWDYCFGWSERWAEWVREGGDGDLPKSPPKPPPMDNVSLPTFLRYCESLGLTPAGRGRIPGSAPKEGGGGGKLDDLDDEVPRPA